ncbi:hypothetical protein CHGG_05539 [Chaetomium globosum CBS 148.51]|uniref:Uncharacterized protein n=1 Tax=Chaetomium globosum (strain ATCC 6205 / CBS 148.51 / DSM 1962 / NBRC 6347 / NRRL 1970) TaxID=306901 RepID=Q2H726_CHAGB|nr:uncharacterized protein CHGG_05539 [Chaetomium globosum CBS 148.51]EAQ88920.1 hypothetical protein CHGG_05539 [Chaetomium globosum CBS 148.51]
MDSETPGRGSGLPRGIPQPLAAPRERPPQQNPNSWTPTCDHSAMAVIYEDAFQCMNCGLFPPLGTLYRCILDRESLIQDAYNDGYSVAFDSIGRYFEKEMSLGKSGPDVRSEPDSSPLTEMPEEQLSSYTPEQLSILESQRNNVHNTIANERSILEHLTSECARDKYPYDAKPWVPATKAECQYKVCSPCHRLGYERTWFREGKADLRRLRSQKYRSPPYSTTNTHPYRGRGPPRGAAKELAKIQSECLRVVAGAYKATQIRSLETETYCPPIGLYLNRRLLAFEDRVRISEEARLIRPDPCHNRCDPAAEAQKGERKTPAGDRRYSNGTSGKGLRRMEEELERWMEEAMRREWIGRWESEVARVVARNPGRALEPADATARFDASIMNRHRSRDPAWELSKAKSTLLVQARTGKSGLRGFLFTRRVPEVVTPVCRCGMARETFEHLVLECNGAADKPHPWPDDGAELLEWLDDVRRLP